ncbi:phasin family protein [Sphingomonas qilianensis]|uniref:Phasin family protein n=1 Tax=Sphingomonas qilianensis TaxID=1736690 RepID=A0ABU9XVL3_9SPHN
MGDTRSTTDKIKDTINEKVVDPATKAGEALRQSGAKVAEGSSTVSMKLLDQAEQNAREAFAALRAAASAKDLPQVLKVQGDYLREQAERSMAQAKEIGELIVKIGQDTVAPLKGE